ncbi:MAG: hypothetical protein A2905_01835 [Candidatus Levybacteria bacterium RIFCSPLOWO2_01_FULL_36_10]|nr:MAG: hypothetical protein A2905_01835 [Candidatus Levybacteria bacterium RIFCSPLOWO2_01_FULL_36_10]
MDSNSSYRTGDTVKVSQKIIEGKKERIVPFSGQVIRMKGSMDNRTITVRQNLDGVYVDRIFSIASPSIVDIKFEASPKKRVRKSKLLKVSFKK